MGADQSNLEREREYARSVAERENVRHAREAQLQETLRLERERNRRAHEELYLKSLEAQQLQEALRRSTAEAQGQLYSNLNNRPGLSTHENYQTTAASNLVVNHDHKRFQPSVLPTPLTPTVCNLPSVTRPPPPSQSRPIPPTINKPAMETSTAALQTNIVHGVVTAPQVATFTASVRAPQMARVGGAVTAPQAMRISGAVTGPQTASVGGAMTAPQAVRISGAVTGPQVARVGGTVTAPQAIRISGVVKGPQAVRIEGTITTPQVATVPASVRAPHTTTVHVTGPQAARVGGAVTAPQAVNIGSVVTGSQAARIGGTSTAHQVGTIPASVITPHTAAVHVAVTSSQADTVPAAEITPQAGSIFASTTVRMSATAPQATTVRTTVTAPQTATVCAALTAPQASSTGASVTAPHVAKVGGAVTMLQTTTVHAAVTAPQAATVCAAVTAPHKKKVLKKKDDSCKTCSKPYGDKIFQCEYGHSSCDTCWTLGLPCGLCRGPITNTRNFDLENYFAANQQVKCANAAEGCILSFKKSEISKHEKECPFKELKCPALVDCNWRGKISQLSIHFDEEHPYSRQANVNTELFLPNISSENSSLQLINMENINFLFYVKVSEIDRRIYMDTQLIGTKATASKWNYEIHVYNNREPHRKYQYIDSCRSTQKTPVDISLRNCAILPLPYAMSFINEGVLTYKINIKSSGRQRRRRK